MAIAGDAMLHCTGRNLLLVGVFALSGATPASAQISLGDILGSEDGSEESASSNPLTSLFGENETGIAAPSPLKQYSQKKGRKYKLKGALIGAGTGAVGGALATESVEGAAVGAVIGGVVGYGVGTELDKRWEDSVTAAANFEADYKAYSESLAVRQAEMDDDAAKLAELQAKTSDLLVEAQQSDKKIKGLKKQKKRSAKIVTRLEKELEMQQDLVLVSDKMIAEIRRKMADESAADAAVMTTLQTQLSDIQQSKMAYINGERRMNLLVAEAKQNESLLQTIDA